MNSTVKSDLVGKIARALERARLGQGKDASILLALSGGPDSVALLHALRTLAPRFGYRLAAAHLNHRLRGAESDRDETFVRELCSTLGVELVAERTDDLDPAASNLEERSREVRYAFLAAAAARLGATHVATAHHADDQAETVMLRLLRGAGAAGLSAMAESVTPAAGSTTILRPMLSVWRHEILRYLDSIGARYVSDSSNAHQGFLRNRVRMELLPALERDFAPGLRRRLAALAMEMRDLDDYVARAARANLARGWAGAYQPARIPPVARPLASISIRTALRSIWTALRHCIRRSPRRSCGSSSPVESGASAGSPAAISTLCISYV